MALSDINFQEGEGRDFLVELPTGTLGTPRDILSDQGGAAAVEELPDGDVFILAE